jgi:integrase
MGMIYKPTYKDKKTGEAKQSAVFWIKYYRGGKAIREGTNTTKDAEARNLLKLREGDVARGVPITAKMGRMKFSELTQDVVTDYKVNGKRSIRDLEMRLRLHILPILGERRASSISTVDIRRFVARRQEEEASNGEVNRELTVIKRAFSLAAQAGKVMARPHIPMLKENNVRTGFFEEEQFENVRAHLPEDLRGVITFAYITGWRMRSEIWPIEWRQVDFAAGTVRLEPGTTKNDEGRVFPMTQALRAVLEGQQAKAEALKKKGVICPWVFHREGNPIREMKRSWKTACRKAGVPGRIPHDFRRSAVRNLVRAGIPERVAMQMTGHKTRSVFERYNIVSEGDLFDAARRLDDFSGKTVVGHFEDAQENVEI